jgi:hypothetical protein
MSGVTVIEPKRIGRWLRVALACTVASLTGCTSSDGELPASGSGGHFSEADGASGVGGGGNQGGSVEGRAGSAIETEAAAPTATSDANADTAALKDGPREAAAFTGIAKIMILGSSNEAITCWRAFLWQKLRAGGITNFDFVGSQTVGPDCGVPGYDQDCEARSGTIITSISADTYHGWFAAHPPDIVLMHIGGADLLNNIPVADVIKTYSVIIEQARAVSPKVIFLVAQHTPQEPTGCTDCRANVIALNTAIVGWAMQANTPESPVSPVDLFTGLDVVTDFSDRVHLNVSGSEKVSDRWLAALVPIFKP